jgi:hypothetical protein
VLLQCSSHFVAVETRLDVLVPIIEIGHSMSMSSCLGISVTAATLLLFTGASTEASIVVTDSSIAYNHVADSLNLELHEESLDNYFGSAPSFTGGSAQWAWELTSSSGVTASNSMVMTGSGNSSLTLNFESDQVFSIGGQFLLLSSEGNPINGIIQLLLSDGTSYISTVSREESFAGFLSDDQNITSLNIIGFGNSAPDVTALSSFTIGVIPAPASFVGFFALIGIGRLRRR